VTQGAAVRGIQKPELQALVESWSPVVTAALEQVGRQVWPPDQEKQGFLKKARLLPRHTVEGPVWRGGEVLWSVSHTILPSAFDIHGNLTEGLREYWIVALDTGQPPCLRIQGAGRLEDIPLAPGDFEQALARALVAGPQQNTFYGNRGPLSQP
jgi:hypothetical protein